MIAPGAVSDFLKFKSIQKPCYRPLFVIPSIMAICLVADHASAQEQTNKPESVNQNATPKKGSKTARKAEFKQRFEKLKADGQLFVVSMQEQTETPSPMGIPEPASGNSMMQVSSRRMITKPDILAPEDIQYVIQANMRDVRYCYKRQLKRKPKWKGNIILDLSIRKSGRVTRAGISPRWRRRETISRCLVRLVRRWKFPAFTGKTDEGIRQDSISASFPFSFRA